MKQKRWVGVLLILFLVSAVVVGVGCFFKVNRDKQEALANKYENRGLPRVEILLNGVELSEIDAGSKDIKYGGNELSIYNNGNVDEYEGVEIKGRGNTTWGQEKKPYRIKFEQKEDLFGLGKARKWNLLANALDGTDLRTETAFYLEEMLGMKYRFEGQFVELYIDGDYRGLYYLTHAVEISKEVVDLRDSIGVLVELDNIYWETGKSYRTKNGSHLSVKDMMQEDKEDEVMSNFLEDYNGLEVAAEKKDFEKISELIDVESFAQYYLLSEFTVNPDAYWTSFYMYKDGVNDVIHAGPGWDFDLSLGNRVWGGWQGEIIYSPNETMVRKRELMSDEEYRKMGVEEQAWINKALSKLVFNLMEIPEFRKEVSRVFQERMSGRKDELVGVISRKYDEIKEALMEDGRKWENKVIGDGIEVGTKLEDKEVVKNIEIEVNELIEWVEKRYDYFEEIYGRGGENERGEEGNIIDDNMDDGVQVKRRML